MNITIDDDRASRWCGDRRVLEALKDGVLFRPLEETLAVDAVAVIRPQLDQADLARGISRVISHEGKLYNFDFDFFRSDRLVCTEVVYRAFDGLGPIEIPLQERSGRPTLSAEDLLDLAFAGNGFDAVAVFGGPSCPDRLVQGDRSPRSDQHREPGAALVHRGWPRHRPPRRGWCGEPMTTPSHGRHATRALLWLGALVAAGNLTALGVLWATDTVLFAKVMAVLGAAYVGGRMAGILTGLELGLGNPITSMVIILFNTGFLLLALPVFRMATRSVNPPRWLEARFRSSEERARSQNQRLESLGVFGLVLFIWLPFPFTGAFLGALIGLLMGISMVRLVPIVLVTMWIGVITWTWGIDFVFLFTGTAGRITAWVLTGIFLVYSVVIRLRNSREAKATRGGKQ